MKTLLLTLLAIPALAHAGGIYWSDRPAAGKAIRGCNFDRSNVRNLVANSSVADPRGVAVDAATGRIYYCDRFDGTAGSGEILYTPLSGSGSIQPVLIGLNRPADLRFDPATRTAANQPWDLDLDRCNATYAEWAARFFRYDAVNNTRTDDPDFDGLKNVAEYAFGSAPLAPNGAPTEWVRVSDGGVDYPAIRFRRRAGTSDLTMRVQVSTDLATWNDNTTGAFTTETGAVAQEDGMDIATVRSNAPLSASPQYLRVKVSAL